LQPAAASSLRGVGKRQTAAEAAAASLLALLVRWPSLQLHRWRCGRPECAASSSRAA
jgi:hypothetical protein